VGFLYLGTNSGTISSPEPLDLSAHVVEWPDSEAP
jgi:hypothetical protein